MQSIISPQIIDSLCDNQSEGCNFCGNKPSSYFSTECNVAQQKQSRWERVLAKIKEVCGLAKPIVEMVTSLIGAVATLVRAFRHPVAYREKGGLTYAH